MVWRYAAAAEGDAMTDPCGSQRCLPHPVTGVLLRDILQCVGPFIVKSIALFCTSLPTARNWIESCTGLSARLQLFRPQMELNSSSTFYLVEFTSKQSCPSVTLQFELGH